MNWIYAIVLLKATNGAIAILEPTRTDSNGFKLGGLQFPKPSLYPYSSLSRSLSLSAPSIYNKIASTLDISLALVRNLLKKGARSRVFFFQLNHGKCEFV